MSHQQDIQRGERAKAILGDELVIEALAALRSTIIGQWCDLGIENKAQAEELKRLLWAADQFESFFTVTIAGSTVAKNELHNQSTMQIRAEAAKQRMKDYA